MSEWMLTVLAMSRFPQLVYLDITVDYISQATPDCMLKQVLIRNPQLKELRVNLADDRKVRLLNAC